MARIVILLVFQIILVNLGFSQPCLLNYTFTADPPPNGGTWNNGEHVSFCLQINQYQSIASNDLIAVGLNFGPGWDISSLSTSPSLPCTGVGSWDYIPNITDPLLNSYGPGFYYTDNDPIPAVIEGDNCISEGPWLFCFELDVGPCNQGLDLSISANTYSDGEIGTWPFVACTTDPIPIISATVQCCDVSAGIDSDITLCDFDFPDNLGTPVNLNDFLIGGNLGGSWFDPFNLAVPGGWFNPTTDIPGTYTYVINGIVFPACSDEAEINISLDPYPYAGPDNTIINICENGPTITVFNFLLGNPTSGGHWEYQDGSLFDGTFTPGTDLDGIYSYINMDAGVCPGDTADVTFNTLPIPNGGSNGIVTLCTTDNPVNLFDYIGGSPDGGGSWSGPSSLTGGALGTFNPGANVGGNYIYSVGTIPCIVNTVVAVTLTTPPNAGTDNTLTLCSNANINYNLFGYLSGGPDVGGTWAFEDLTPLPGGTFNPTVNPFGVYTYTIGSPTCFTTSQIEIIPQDSPEASMTGDIILCGATGVPLTFDFTGDGPFDVTIEDDQGNPPFLLTGINDGHIEMMFPVTTTIYTITSFSDQGNPLCIGEINNGTVTVTINSPPSAEISGPAEICLGSTADLIFSLIGNGPFVIEIDENGDGISDYNLGNMSDGDVYSVSPSSSTTYTILSITDNSVPPCTVLLNNESVTIDIISPPTATLSGGGNLCPSEPGMLTFDIDGPWIDYNVVINCGFGPMTLNNVSDGETVSTPIISSLTCCIESVTPVADNTCVSTNVFGCADFDVVTPPTYNNFSVTCDPITEQGTVSFNIIGGDPGSYLVTSGNGMLIGNTFTSVLFNNGSNYMVSFDDANGCGPINVSGTISCNCVSSYEGTMITTDTLQICENLPANATFNDNELLEPGDIIQFVIHNNSGPNLGNVLAVSNTPVFFYNASMAYETVYYISVISGINDGSGNVNLSDPCLTVSEGVPVIFHEEPVATISGQNSICAGEAAALFVDLTGTGPWTLVIGLNNSPVIGSPFIVNASPFNYNAADPGTYSILNVSNSFCNGIGFGEVIVDLNELPTAMLSGTGIYCENSGDGPTINLTGTGPFIISYSIDNNPQPDIMVPNGPIQIPAIIQGTYEITAVSDANCNDDVNSSLIVTILEQPSATISGGGIACDGDSLAIDISLTGGSIWDFVPSFNGINWGDTITTNQNNFTLYTNTSGTYSVNYLSDENCPGTINGNAAVLIHELPEASMSTGSTTICDGDEFSVTFYLTGTGPFNVQYGLNNNPMNLNSISSGHSENFVLSESSEIYISSIEDIGTGCSNQINDTISIIVNEYPLSYAGPDIEICSGTQGILGLEGDPTLTYVWIPTWGLYNPTSSESTILLNNDNFYTEEFEYILATTENGCTSFDTAIVSVDPSPHVDFNFSPSPVTASNPTVNFFNLTPGTNHYEWDFAGLGEANSINSSFTFPLDVVNKYVVCLFATSENIGCSSQICKEIDVVGDLLMYVPNSFTPNGDGINDFFFPVMKNHDPGYYEFLIFDRNGHLIFETDDPNAKWNGSEVNQEYFTEIGVYTWKIRTRDVFTLKSVEFFGHVTILR